MLRKETVDAGTLELLNDLMRVPEVKAFALIGGTSLALRYGHRKSLDLDFFSNQPFNELDLLLSLKRRYREKLEEDSQEKQTLRLFIREIKVEFIAPNLPYLKPIQVIEGIRLFSEEDTLSFKLNAIERRGARRDFYDVYEALDHFSISQLIGFYQEKFSTTSITHLVKSLIYFGDANKEKDPVLIKTPSWDEVKKRIEEAVKGFAINK